MMAVVYPNPLPANLNEVTHICCIGVTHQSVMNMAVIAEAYPNKIVTMVDHNELRLLRWTIGQVDLIEEGFEDLLQDVLAVNLVFSGQIDVTINQAQMIFICVDIPTRTDGFGGLDLTEWEAAVRSIVRASTTSKIIVEKSTMPVDVFNLTTSFLAQRTPMEQFMVQFAVFANPDFSCPGLAINDLRQPGQVIIARKSAVGNLDVLGELYSAWVPPNNIFTVPNHLTAELGKIVTSVMAGFKITIMNVISSYCQSSGAYFNHIQQLLGRDYRFDANYMDSTLGIGGPELIKDISYFKDTLLESGFVMESTLINQIVKLDRMRRKQFLKLILAKMATVTDKRIAVFGVTYKSNISDVRKSAAISVCKSLLKQGAFLTIFDMLLDNNTILSCFRNAVNVQVAANEPQAYDQADAALFLVEGNLQIDFVAMRNAMRRPRYLFFARKFNFNYQVIHALGFEVHIFGDQF